MPNHKFTVSVDPAAYDKMFAHIRFLARVSVPAAGRLYDALEEAINALQTNPEGYPLYVQQKQLDALLRYKLCDKRYRIVFEIIGNAVYVYDIQDCRQDTDKNLV